MMSTKEADKFLSISKQLLTSKCYTISDKNDINACLTELNTLNYAGIPGSGSDMTMLLINWLCKSIQASDSILVTNFCQFIMNLVKAGTIICGRTFSTCLKWTLQVLEFADPQIRSVILITLRITIDIGPFDIINQDMQTLLTEEGLLKTLVSPNSETLEIKFLAIACIEAFFANRERNSGVISQQSKVVVKNIVYNLFSSWKSNEHDHLHYSKIIGCCLRILQYMVDDKWLNEDANAINDILGIIQVYLFYGMKDYSFTRPQCLRPALTNIPEQIITQPRARSMQSRVKPKTKKHSAKKGNNNSTSTTSDVQQLGKCTSDSDTSDGENLVPGRVDTKVRLETIHLLNKIIHEVPCRVMFGYWSQIIVNTTNIPSRVLVWSIIKETSSKLRQTALSTLTDAIVSARSILVHAEDTEHPTFRTFFGTVSAMIRELHSLLSLILGTEKNITVLTHALKCATALVQTTPYSRLKPGIATKLLHDCRPYISDKDPTIRVAALSVFEAILSADKLTVEICSVFQADSQYIQPESVQSNQCARNSNSTEGTSSKNMSFYLQICLENISNKAVQVPVRLQSLKLLSALINDDTDDLVLKHLQIVTQCLAEAAQEEEIQIALHVGRVIEKISSYLTRNSHAECMKDFSIFWNTIFQPIITLAQREHINLREVACDCLGTISNGVWTQLTHDRQILVITVLFSATRNEESAVRAAGLRSLGMLIALPSLEEDTGFIMDLVDVVCQTIEDENLGVRVKAAWALANLSDCLIKQKDNQDIEPIPLEVLLPRLYDTSIKAAQDNNKVKCNALRAVGNILHSYEDLEITHDASAGLDILISCATLGNDMKVRWNACRALGLIIGDKPESILPENWRDRIFPALCDLICHSPNFKVRTNAAWALTACHDYGKYIPYLWKNIVLALENSHHVPNFVEYPHRDALIQQLCLALGHIAARTDLMDLPTLWSEIKDHIVDLQLHMKQFQERVLPEKTDDFVKAKLQFQNYSSVAKTATERKIAGVLAGLLESHDSYTESDQLLS